MICKCLNIHYSVYYYHQNHHTNSYKVANQKLDSDIKKIYDESKGRYGSPKITKVLESKGIKVSQKRVARRMKFLGLRSIIVKKFNHAGISKTDNTKEYPNMLEQDFFAEKPSQKWVGDITYIYTIFFSINCSSLLLSSLAYSDIKLLPSLSSHTRSELKQYVSEFCGSFEIKLSGSFFHVLLYFSDGLTQF